MRVKRFLVTALVAVAVIAIGLVAYRLEAPRGPAICQICDRVIHKQTAFDVDTTTGTIKACCPACAMHYMLHNQESVRKGWTTDFTTGHMIPAKDAFYDAGGDTQYCTRHQPAVERDPEGVRARVYDRCLPVLVAFAHRDEAEAYRQEHGGQVLTYNQAADLVKNQ